MMDKNPHLLSGLCLKFISGSWSDIPSKRSCAKRCNTNGIQTFIYRHFNRFTVWS